MLPSDLADSLLAEAAKLREHAGAILMTGEPVSVPWGPNGGSKSLHELTSFDLVDEAYALEQDADKLRKLYS